MLVSEHIAVSMIFWSSKFSVFCTFKSLFNNHFSMKNSKFDQIKKYLRIDNFLGQFYLRFGCCRKFAIKGDQNSPKIRKPISGFPSTPRVGILFIHQWITKRRDLWVCFPFRCAISEKIGQKLLRLGDQMDLNKLDWFPKEFSLFWSLDWLCGPLKLDKNE